MISLKEKQGVDIGNLYLNSLVNIGICYKITEQFEKAVDYYEKANQLDPNDEVALYNHAMAIMSILRQISADSFQEVTKERARKAETLLKKVLSKNPQNQMAELKLLVVNRILNP